MNLSSAIETINHASEQSDRWMFIALLVVVLVACAIVFKYLTLRLERVEKKMDQVQVEFNMHLKTANKDMLDVLSLSNNTIGRNMTILDRIERKLEQLWLHTLLKRIKFFSEDLSDGF